MTHEDLPKQMLDRVFFVAQLLSSADSEQLKPQLASEKEDAGECLDDGAEAQAKWLRLDKRKGKKCSQKHSS